MKSWYVKNHRGQASSVLSKQNLRKLISQLHIRESNVYVKVTGLKKEHSFSDDNTKILHRKRSSFHSREKRKSKAHMGERDHLFCLFLFEQTHYKTLIN